MKLKKNLLGILTIFFRLVNNEEIIINNDELKYLKKNDIDLYFKEIFNENEKKNEISYKDLLYKLSSICNENINNLYGLLNDINNIKKYSITKIINDFTSICKIIIDEKNVKDIQNILNELKNILESKLINIKDIRNKIYNIENNIENFISSLENKYKMISSSFGKNQGDQVFNSSMFNMLLRMKMAKKNIFND